jgi:flagellar protein FlbD
MIPVTKLDGSEIWVNPELIQFMKATPDTVITLTTGEKLIVKEEIQKIRDSIIQFYKQVYENKNNQDK